MEGRPVAFALLEVRVVSLLHFGVVDLVRHARRLVKDSKTMSSAGLARKCKDEMWLVEDEERKKAIETV